MADWQSVSEILVGKILDGQYSANAVDPDDLYPPYGEIVKLVREKRSLGDIVERISFHAVDACTQAAKAVDGIDVEWPLMAERAALRSSIGKRLGPIVKKLERGEDADVAKALQLLGQFETEYKQFTPMSEVSPEENVWIPTHYEPIDKYMNGVPTGALTILAGPPGVGKTSLLARIMTSMARNGERVAFFSLEMTLASVMMRMLEIDPKLRKKDKEMILATEDEYDVDEVYAASARVAAAYPDLRLIGIDFADLMIEGEEKTAKASHIYRTMQKLAKRLNVPIILLAQLSEGYVGGIPRIHHIRWSRLAEAVARMILLIWNPDQIWADQGQNNPKSPLRYIPEKGYIIQGKSNYGYKMGSTGAVLVDWNKKQGWGDTGLDWYPLAGA